MVFAGVAKTRLQGFHVILAAKTGARAKHARFPPTRNAVRAESARLTWPTQSGKAAPLPTPYLSNLRLMLQHCLPSVLWFSCRNLLNLERPYASPSLIEQSIQCAFQLKTRDGLLPGKIPLHLGYDWNRPECWPEHLHDAVARWMSLADRTAREIVQENAGIVKRLAERLKADRELSGKVLADLLSEASPAQIQLSPYERQRAVAT